ncbi:MAG: phosphoribosylformylglycinamidine synthase subunit PurQ, partial [Bacteroidales bacterium]|nr:phosphoribosylformylglycinamidine synthase subunit PurQ [Bacteroidales bacterium]
LSMAQKYEDDVIYSPGTVIISAAGEVSDIKKIVTPVLKDIPDTILIHIDFSSDDLNLGGSAFAQMMNQLGDSAPTVTDPGYFIKAFNTLQKLIGDSKILAGHDISSGGLITALCEMTFARNKVGLDINLDAFEEDDLIKILFSENPGVLIQVQDNNHVTKLLEQHKLKYKAIGKPGISDFLRISHNGDSFEFGLDKLRDTWFKTSYLLDRKQSGELLAKARFMHYKNQKLSFNFPYQFSGKAVDSGADKVRKAKTGIKAAIIREKGVNGDREMAWSLYLAGFDVKDVHMTDLISGRETLERINMIVFVGGFSNSDVLGSGKGWAGAFLYNKRAKETLERFYKKENTLSLGICNGCQLMIELGLIYPEKDTHPKMEINESGKFESAFLNVDILPNHSVMLSSLSGTKLGIWVAHGEGKFVLNEDEGSFQIPVKYSYDEYPGNPNGSAYNAAAICSENGRHLAMMPHLERAVMPWQWGYYPEERKDDEITPWVRAFVNAKNWIIEKKQT